MLEVKKKTLHSMRNLFIVFEVISIGIQHLLRMCLQLLNPLAEVLTARLNLMAVVGEECNDHGCVLDRFCAECGEMVCRICVKNSHATHCQEFMDDILLKDPDAATLTTKLENKIGANINNISKSISVSTEICNIIDELSHYKKSLENWKDKLCSEKKLAEQHLMDWNDARNKCSKEKHQIFKKLCHHWKGVDLPPDPFVELTSLTKKLEELNKCAAQIQELMPKPEGTSERKELSKMSSYFVDGKKWCVESDEDSQGAISSVRAGKIPCELEVVSSPGAPIQNLPEVLNFIGSACADRSISVKPLDTFWAPSSTTDSRHYQAFIKYFGRKLNGFYGFPDEVVTLCRVNPKLDFVGVRLASMADVNQCTTASKKPRTVCCIQSLPAAAGARMLELGWTPFIWHFPDAKAGSVDWMISLMEPVTDATNGYFQHSILLPRCTLNHYDFHVLLKKYSKYRVKIYCEHSSLPASDKSDLELMAEYDGSEIRFLLSIPLDCA